MTNSSLVSSTPLLVLVLFLSGHFEIAWSYKFVWVVIAKSPVKRSRVVFSSDKAALTKSQVVLVLATSRAPSQVESLSAYEVCTGILDWISVSLRYF